MLKPLTPRQQTLIVNNIVRACDDIEKLNKTGYRFINLCIGFIAHYDLYGFRAAYDPIMHGFDLRSAILRNEQANDWRNFRPGDRDYEYYKSKADTYYKIVQALKA